MTGKIIGFSLAAVVSAGLTACSSHKGDVDSMRMKHDDAMSMGRPTTQPAATAYTCTMHPEVVSDKPGKCPKCGMALVAKR